MKANENPKNWKEHINTKYGEKETESRKKFEEEFESFRIGVLIQEASCNKISQLKKNDM